jgi:hypothetical protein
MVSVVTGVMDARVGARVGPEGWLGLPGARTPGESHESHPSGALTT